MKALLLAAGLGTRLRPITNETPKCLIPIKGRPLLDIWIEILLDANITKILINTHYLHKQVEEFVENSQYKPYIELVYEDNLLGTGGTLLKNKLFFDDNDPFIVIHADNYCKCDFRDFIKSHFYKPSYTLMTMMIFKTLDPKSCGIVELDNNNVVQKFHEKVNNPPSNLANAAIYIFDSEIFGILENYKKMFIDISIDVLPKLLGKIYTYKNNNINIDIGTINNLQIANNLKE